MEQKSSITEKNFRTSNQMVDVHVYSASDRNTYVILTFSDVHPTAENLPLIYQAIDVAAPVKKSILILNLKKVCVPKYMLYFLRLLKRIDSHSGTQFIRIEIWFPDCYSQIITTTVTSVFTAVFPQHLEKILIKYV